MLFEPRTNQLFVTDIPSKLEEVQTLITKIDIPVRQVLIEARIVEADDSFGRALGIKLGATDLRGLRGGIPGYSLGGNNYAAIGGNYSNAGVQTGQTPVTPTSYIPDSQFVNLPANTSSFGGASAATFALSLFSATANRFLNLELSALESDGKGQHRLQPARHHVGPDQGADRARRRDSVPASHVQRRHVGAIQQRPACAWK